MKGLFKLFPQVIRHISCFLFRMYVVTKEPATREMRAGPMH